MFLVGCAGIPVREAVKVDLSIPVGKIEGNQFTGLRYPFKVSAPLSWKITTEIPTFMEEVGYEKPGLEESEVFVFNPLTQSNLQIDFVPAGRSGSLTDELKEDLGKDLQVNVGPTERISLKGVPYAAKKYATYTVKGVKREQGWIYAFSEPYQIFILYMILEKDGTRDRQDMQAILDSFEVISKK
jgi:hypothetical protein